MWEFSMDDLRKKSVFKGRMWRQDWKDGTCVWELVLAIKRCIWERARDRDAKYIDFALQRTVTKAAGKQTASVEATSDLTFSSISFEIPLRILK